jgi:hypothetical protein
MFTPILLKKTLNLYSVRQHIDAALWSGIVVPPAASLLLFAHILVSTSWIDGASALDIPYFLVIVFMFAVPVGYAFGVIPALLAGAIYSGVLTAMPTGQPHPLLRAGVGAVCGGLTGWVWFHAVAGPSWFIFVATEALVMALFAICRTVGAVREDARQLNGSANASIRAG